MSWGWKQKASAATIAAFCLFGAGRCSADDRGIAEPEAKRPEPVRTVTASPEVSPVKPRVTVKHSVPESCLMALDGLEKISKAASSLADVGTPQLDIMSRAHEAIAGGDYAELVNLQEDQMKINDKTLQHVHDLELDLLPPMKRYGAQCRQADKE